MFITLSLLKTLKTLGDKPIEKASFDLADLKAEIENTTTREEALTAAVKMQTYINDLVTLNLAMNVRNNALDEIISGWTSQLCQTLRKKEDEFVEVFYENYGLDY